MRRPRLHLSLRLALLAVAIAAVALSFWPRKGLRVGQVAPPVLATLPDGNFDVENGWDGKFVLLSFWSMKDPASLRQFESLKAIRREFAGNPRLRMLSVCTDEDWDGWLRFQEGQGKVNYGDARGTFTFFMDHQWWNASQAASPFVSTDAYEVTRLPAAFLIGPDRRLRALWIPTDRLRDVVARALKGAP